MKIQASLHLNNLQKNLIIYPHLNETPDHMALKLAAALLFDSHDPLMAPSPQHPALLGQEFVPDLMAVDDVPQVTLWVECEKTTSHKLSKVSRRFRSARVEVFTVLPREGKQMVEIIEREKIDGIGVLSFGEGEFQRWRRLVLERNEIIGEASEDSLNLVINDQVFVTDFVRIRAGLRRGA